jgi:hypothetical protein
MLQVSVLNFPAVEVQGYGLQGPRGGTGATGATGTGVTGPTGADSTIPGPTGATGSALTIDRTLPDLSVSGVKIPATANENQAVGDICRINSSGKAQIAKSDEIANATGFVMCAEAVSADASGLYLWLGIARNDAWAWTVGGKMYLSTTGTTGNTLTQTRPDGSGNVAQIVGIALATNIVAFNANLVQTEHV